MRSLVIRAETEDLLRHALKGIPGYVYVPLGPELRRIMGPVSGEERFRLQAPGGARIMIRHRHGEPVADTVNVEDQDFADNAVPLHADELVALHRVR